MEYITKMECHDETKAIRELIPDLEETVFLKNYVIHKEICFGDGVGLSVQAGTGFHSIPRESVGLSEYKAMEMAVNKHGDLVPIESVLPEFKHKEVMHEKLLSDNISVYGCVPVEVIEEVYQGLKKEYGLE